MHLTTIEIFIFVFFSIIIFINLLLQIKYFYFLIEYDFLGLFMIWTLFTPRPISFDYKLFYRDLLNDGTKTNLKELKQENFFSLFSIQDKIHTSLLKSIYYLVRMKQNKIKDNDIVSSYYFKIIISIVKNQDDAENINIRQIILSRINNTGNEINYKNLIISNINYNGVIIRKHS